MARRVFYSFHYSNDNWRASTVRNIGSIEGNKPATDNDWEKVTTAGDNAIEKWIKEQMEGRSCVVVLAGEHTAGRKWINYEIIEGWKLGKGILGIQIHKLKNVNEEQGKEGKNPFDCLTFGEKSFSEIVQLKKVTHNNSKDAYDYIKNNIEKWIEEAIEIRKKH